MGMCSGVTKSRAPGHREWYYRDRERILAVKAAYRKAHPWRMILSGVRQRCTNPRCSKYKYYGARGIFSTLTEAQIHALWLRDKAALLSDPTLDRVRHTGNYTFTNCRFIERKENSARAMRFRKRRKNA
jgi:hypothetical protein